MQETILKNGRQYRSHPVSSSKNIKKNINSSYVVTSFGLFIFKKGRKCMGTFNDEISRIRVWIQIMLIRIMCETFMIG